MLIWFVVIGILGLVGIAKAPGVLAALSPLPRSPTNTNDDVAFARDRHVC
jgi:hypothetical protein